MIPDLERIERDIDEIKMSLCVLGICVCGIGLGTLATALWLLRTAP